MPIDSNREPSAADFVSHRVWDLPTRFFHWLLALCIIALLITGSVGGNAMIWHLKLGYAALTLILFRIVWGGIGGYWSRFQQFFYSPLIIIRYIKGVSRPEHEIGHNPLGSLSVWAFLLLLAVQVATGLVSDDEIATQGPFVKFVSHSVSLLATSYHKHWGQWIIIALIVLHIAAVLFYLFKKKNNLIAPMLHGDKKLDAQHAHALPVSKDGAKSRITALLIFALIAIAVSDLAQRFG